MKKFFNFAIAALSTIAVVASCTKEQNVIVPEDKSQEGIENTQPREQITISATLSDALTKVAFDPAYDAQGKPSAMALTWAEGDKLRVYDHADKTKYSDFTLAASSVGQKKGVFTGEKFEADSYDVEIINGDVDFATQTQPADGETANLKYMASANNIVELDDFELTDFSSVLAITAKMPAGAAAGIKSLEITASEAIFNAGNSLTITFDTVGDAGDDGILHFFANLPVGDTTIPAGTTLLMHFYAPETEHTVYTRYMEMAQAVTFTANKLNAINVNASKSDKHAGLTSCDGTTAAKAYLIGDKYQLQAVNGEMVANATIFFKMVDDVDMSGESWTSLNPDPFTKAVNFDGNNKTISKLNASLFDDLNGTITNLTIKDATVSGGSAITGILANTVKTAASTVTNVDVTGTNTEEPYSSTVSATGYTGGLVGQTDVTATITDCAVSYTSVSGTLAGGVIGFASSLVTVSGCSFSCGTVNASARYCGGVVASTGNFGSVFSDCHVQSSTLTSASDRAGGFAGLLQGGVQVKGCSVGTTLQRVVFNSTKTSATANVGGFVGVNYGTITKDGDERCKAYVQVKSSNTTTGNSMNIGGFVGYNTGTIEYCDADVDMASLKGQYIGGFCGILLQSGIIRYCTETGIVTGNNYTGGFVGVIDSATTSITGCTSAGSVTAASSIGGFAGGCTAKDKPGTFIGNGASASVTSSGSNFGGFIGNGVGTFTSNYATGDVASSGGGNGGGFAGGIWEASTGTTFSKNYATGKVSGNANLGGLIGFIGGNLTMSDCYATGNVGNSTKYNQKYGGLVGFTSDNATYITSGVIISNCYATGDIEASFGSAGLIGRIGLATTTVQKCAAWNAKVFPHSTLQVNWSSAAVVGVAFPKCTLTDNYRNPIMNLVAYWVPANMNTFQHANVSSSHPLTDSTGTEMGDSKTASGQAHYPQYPYHGKVEAGKTLSELASTTLGWSSDVWDFSGELPVLK